MANARYWVPTTTGAFSSPRDDETVSMRRRTRHSASIVGGHRQRQPLLIDVQHLAWMDDAACIGTDPEAFFPDGTPEVHALRVCEVCPVKEECGEFALADPTIKGIWGGLSEKERTRIREKRTRERRRDAS